MIHSSLANSCFFQNFHQISSFFALGIEIKTKLSKIKKVISTTLAPYGEPGYAYERFPKTNFHIPIVKTQSKQARCKCPIICTSFIFARNNHTYHNQKNIIKDQRISTSHNTCDCKPQSTQKALVSIGPKGTQCVGTFILFL